MIKYFDRYCFYSVDRFATMQNCCNLSFFLKFWSNNCLKFSHRKHGLNKPLTILVKSDLSFLVNSAAIISKMYLKLFAVSFVYNIPYVWFIWYSRHWLARIWRLFFILLTITWEYIRRWNYFFQSYGTFERSTKEEDRLYEYLSMMLSIQYGPYSNKWIIW